MKLTLLREPSRGDHTYGVLFVDQYFQCFTLEDVIRAPGVKVPLATAIPPGRYRIILNMSPRFGRRLPLLLQVPGFEGIRIHPGNAARDTEGCILVGMRRDLANGKVLESRVAMKPLLEALEAANGESWITIVNPEPVP